MNDSASPTNVFGLPAQRGRWLFLLLGILVNICLGSVYAYSVFKEPLRAQFGLSATQANLPFMIFIAVFSIGTFFAGRFIDQYGPRRAMMTGSVLVGAGWMLARFSGGLGAILLTYSLLGGLGVGIVYGGPVAVAARWFPDRKGLAVGLTLVGFGMSALVTAPLARHLIGHPAVGVLDTFGIMGLAFLVLCVVLSGGMRFPEPGWRPAGWTPPAHGAGALIPSLSRREMARTSAFWALMICYILGTTAGLMAIGISAPVAREIVQLDPGRAAMLVSVFAIFNGGGRPLFGWLADRITPRGAALLAFAIILLCSLGMRVAGPGQAVLYVACFCGFWLCLGGWLAIGPATTASFFGMEGYAQKYGLVFLAYGLGAIFGGIVSGVAHDVFGSYAAAFRPTAAMAAAGLLVAGLFLKPPPSAR